MAAIGWITRRALRYGSEKTGFFRSKKEAVEFAKRDIKKNGGAGRIEVIVDRTVYYDVYEEMD